MSNTQQIETSLKNLILNNDREFVAMLSGEWGIGKTYFWKEFTKKYLKDKDVVYISLFGKNSLVDIETEILTKLSRFNQFKEQNKTILSWLKKATSFASNASGFPVNIASGAILSLFGSNDFKNIVICFDDFERLSEKVSLKDVMGLISQFKEQKECKIIMILNEKELDKLSGIDGKKHDEIFALYKEKVVDYNFHYHPSQDELFEAVKADIEKIKFCEHQTIYDFFKKTDLKNIRIMKQALYLLEKFSFIQSKGYDKKVIDEFVEIALNLFVFKAKSNYTYIEFHDMQEYISNDWARDIAKEENRTTDLEIDEKHEVNRLHYHTEDKFFSNHYYSHNKDILESNIYNFIDTHSIKKEELENLLNENHQSLSWYDIRAAISKIYKRFVTDFSTSTSLSELAKQLFKLLSKHKDDMHHLFSYSDYKPFIERINELAPKILTEELEKKIAKKYLDFYITNYDYAKHGLAKNGHETDLIISHYPWAKEYKNKKKKAILTINDALELIEQVVQNRYPSEENIYKLKQISANHYENLIKENPNFVELLLKLVPMLDPEVKINIITALNSLKDENDDYAWKVNQIAKNAYIDLEEDKQ